MPYNPKYNDQNYKYRTNKFHRVGVDFDKEYFTDTLKPAAEAAGESVNGYIKTAIRERIDRDTRRAAKSGKS